jgi:hypothetical protein
MAWNADTASSFRPYNEQKKLLDVFVSASGSPSESAQEAIRAQTNELMGRTRLSNRGRTSLKLARRMHVALLLSQTKRRELCLPR